MNTRGCMAGLSRPRLEVTVAVKHMDINVVKIGAE